LVNTGGSRRAGVEPARDAAWAMYGFVPERLEAEDGSHGPDSDHLLADYQRRLSE
jgi:hypothetical protein